MKFEIEEAIREDRHHIREMSVPDLTELREVWELAIATANKLGLKHGDPEREKFLQRAMADPNRSDPEWGVR